MTALRLAFHRVDDWPPLAWLAACDRASAIVKIYCGRHVEVRERWFCEAVWAGDFEAGDFDATDLIAGSDGRMREDGLVFVLVRKMARRTRARVLTYGLAEDAVLRATNVRARWPERLSFSAHYEGRTAEVCTQLCGAHVVSNVLAALAAGVAIGIPLEEAADAVASMPPIEPRLYPVDHPDGFTIVRDDYKAPLWSIPAALDFVREATASRKVIVLGTISDYAGPSDRTYQAVARQALEVAERVVFVGSHSVKA